MSVKPPRNREHQSESTRAALLATARSLFARRGYPDVSVDEIVQAAGLTKGALYHHYQDKEGLFHGVVEQIEKEIYARLTQAAGAQVGHLDQLRAACHAY